MLTTGTGSGKSLAYLVDEHHTHRGRQGADVALFVRRVREATGAAYLQHAGTSATIAGPGTLAEQQKTVAEVASVSSATRVEPATVIGETLRRATHAFGDTDALRARVEDRTREPPGDFYSFAADPLAGWLGFAEEPGTVAPSDPSRSRSQGRERHRAVGVRVTRLANLDQPEYPRRRGCD